MRGGESTVSETSNAQLCITRIGSKLTQRNTEQEYKLGGQKASAEHLLCRPTSKNFIKGV